MTVKERLFQLMEEIGSEFNSRGVTTIMCLDTDENVPAAILGYRGKFGYGKFALVALNEKAAQSLMEVAWDAAHNPKYRNGSNSEQ
ncbi:MAG: hypothetical protein J1E82_09835 [Muribaculaceae bacterium]|nr:hypothetical protein [Muribaculaceae bacterium]